MNISKSFIKTLFFKTLINAKLPKARIMYEAIANQL